MNEIKEVIEQLYEFVDKKNKLKNDDKEKVAELMKLIDISNANVGKFIANLILKFDINICKKYFAYVCENFTVDGIDCLVNELINIKIKNTYSKESYIKKCIFLAQKALENDNITKNSKALPNFIGYIAFFSYGKTGECESTKEFKLLNDNTNGKLFDLNYEGVKHTNFIWKITNKLYPDLQDLEYYPKICNFALQQNYMAQDEKSKLTQIKQNNPANDKNQIKKKDKSAVKSKENKGKNIPAKNNEEKIKKQVISENLAYEQFSELYFKLKDTFIKNLDKNFVAINTTLSSLSDSTKTLQNDFKINQTILSENTELKISKKDLEEKLQILEKTNNELNAELQSLKSELSSKIEENTVLTDKITEMDLNLKEVYSINSREASLEAERIRENISKAMSLLYEDWLDYQYAEYSQVNYESLQVIIKSIFKALEKQNINFEGNE